MEQKRKLSEEDVDQLLKFYRTIRKAARLLEKQDEDTSGNLLFNLGFMLGMLSRTHDISSVIKQLKEEDQ